MACRGHSHPAALGLLVRVAYQGRASHPANHDSGPLDDVHLQRRSQLPGSPQVRIFYLPLAPNWLCLAHRYRGGTTAASDPKRGPHQAPLCTSEVRRHPPLPPWWLRQRRTPNLGQRASPPLRQAPARRIRHLQSAGRHAHHFFALISFITSISRSRSATSFFSRAFSDSSCVRRRTSSA